MRQGTLHGLVCLVLMGCQEPEAPKEIAKQNVSSLKQGLADFSSSDWAHLPNEDTSVATVNGVPISRDNFEYQAATTPEESPRDVLNRLIELEVLAQQAAKDGFGVSTEVLKVREKAVARAYLRNIFEKEVTPKSYPIEQVKEDYRRNKHVFWHDHDEIRAVQLMETCCDARDGNEECVSEEDVACFAEAAGRMAEYEKELRERLAKVEKTPEAIKKVLADFRSEIDVANPNLRYEDITKPIRFVVGQSHEWHIGKYDVFAREVVEALFSVDELELSPPVQSSFGWHLLDTTSGTLVLNVTEIVLTQSTCGVLCPMRLTSNTRPRTFSGQHSCMSR